MPLWLRPGSQYTVDVGSETMIRGSKVKHHLAEARAIQLVLLAGTPYRAHQVPKSSTAELGPAEFSVKWGNLNGDLRTVT